jgi:hypothetical protein
VFIRIKDLIIAGSDKAAVLSCFDISGKKAPSLNEDRVFMAAMSAIGKNADIVTFGDCPKIVDAARKLVDTISNRDIKEKFDEFFKPYSGYKTFCYAEYPGEIRKAVASFNIDKAKMEPFIKSCYSMVPRENATIKMVPADAALYSWGTMAWKDFWKTIKEESNDRIPKDSKAVKFDDAISDFEKRAGFSLENDLIPALGDEAGFYLTDINYDGFIPSPKFVIIVKISNKEMADKISGVFFKGGQDEEAALKTETYDSIEIKYLDLPFGLAFQPSYCYIGDYFLFSLGRSPLKSSIDAYSGKERSLMDVEEIKVLNGTLAGPANKVTYAKVDILSKKGIDFCDWGLRWLAYTTEQEMEYYEKQKKYEEMMTTQIDRLRDDISGLEKELTDMKARRAGPAVTAEVKAELDPKIWEKNAMLKIDKEQLSHFEEQEKHRIEATKPGTDIALIRLWIEKAAYPVLEGLKPINTVVSKTVYTENSAATEYFSEFKMKK